MAIAHWWRSGIALAITAGAAYAACALVFWIWPEAAATFMNGLFHGLDFRRLQAGPGLFDFSSFFYALCGLVVWAFLVGALFAVVSDAFEGRDGA